ncbi:MAG: cellulase family glycosylhydrolase [Anaerolineae bacterium]|nr:cellulase family glycosylhydrolase [Anaerolineae bacterium]
MKQPLLRIVGLCGLLVVFTVSSSIVQAQPSAALRVDGVTLVDGSGSRFIVKGVNMETWRDRGCSAVTLQQYEKRDEIAERMSSLGINAVRMNYYQAWLYQGDNLSKFLDLAETLVDHGMYVMPSDHTFSSKSLGNRQRIFPMFQSIIEGMRERGLEDHLIFNPYNEPGPVDRWSAWIEAQNDTLDFLRNTAGFKGVVVLDSRAWAADYDIDSYQQVMDHDAELLGGEPNVIFSNHWYPNISILHPRIVSDNANLTPVIFGEIGQMNPGVTPPTPRYVQDLLDYVVEVGIPNSHNGVFLWLWSWCDRNSATREDYLTLTNYGQIYVDHYLSKVKGDEPVVKRENTATPTATATP